MTRKRLAWFLVLILVFSIFCDSADARRRRRHRHRRRYKGPPPTHPVILWARTLSQSSDNEQRRIAAFKLSQYSQPIFQEQVVNQLLKCMKDSDKQIMVLCTKALGNVRTHSFTESIRKALLDHYNSEEDLRHTVVRTFIQRKDSSPKVQDTFMESAKKSDNPEDLLVLLSYFEKFGSGSPKFVENLAQIYHKQESIKVKRAAVRVLADRAEGQDSVIDLLSQCAQNKDTPLALTCLGGLQAQARKDPRAWSAVENTIQSDDPDVLMASLDVINALPESRNEKISNRLVDLIGDVDDSEIQEKAVLGLGVVGMQSESIVSTLLRLLEEKETDESVRIASALILGKQAVAFPDKALSALQTCSKSGASQSLRAACGLGLQDLEAHKVKASPAPASTSADAAAPDDKKSDGDEAKKDEKEDKKDASR